LHSALIRDQILQATALLLAEFLHQERRPFRFFLTPHPLDNTLVDSKTSLSGVIIATLKRAGDVRTGSF